MQEVFESINGIFAFIGPLSDFLWDFPTNFEWYASIPLLGNFSFAIILLLGSGIFFSFRIGFMQVTHFKKGIGIMTEKRTVDTGISPLAAFLLSRFSKKRRTMSLLGVFRSMEESFLAIRYGLGYFCHCFISCMHFAVFPHRDSMSYLLLEEWLRL